MCRSSSAVIVAASLVVAAAHAEPARARPLTLEDAVAIAIARDADVGRADLAVERGATDELQSWAGIGPDVSVDASVGRTLGRSFSQQEGGIVSGTSDQAGAGVEARIELFSGFATTAAILRARDVSAAARRRRDRVRQDVAFAATRDFFALLQSRSLQDVRLAQRAAQEELLAVVRREVDVGRRSPADLHLQEAARAEAELAVVDATGDAGRAEIQLRRTLRMGPAETLDLVAPATELPTDALPPAVALVDDALGRRADLRALQAEADAAAHGVLLARAGFWPRLALRAGYGTTWSSLDLRPVPGTGLDPRVITVTPDEGGAPATFPVPGTGHDPTLVEAPFVDQLLSRHGGSVSLHLTLPIFDGLQTWRLSRAAEAELATARLLVDEQRAAVAAEVEAAVLDARTARARLAATSARLRAAEQGSAAARRLYELGRGTLLEVSQAEQVLVDARSAAVRAQYEVRLTEKLVAYRAGTIADGGAR